MDPQDSMNKKPLYRKKNKILHNGWSSYHFPRARYRFERHSKKVEEAVDHLPVKRYQKYHRTGYDYTPLIRFLHAHVGQAWDPVFQECRQRLDNTKPLTWMVENVNERGQVVRTTDPEELQKCFWLGEWSYWSSLYVDENGLLQFVDKDFDILEALSVNYICMGETVTWNGQPVKIPDSDYYGGNGLE